jgi:hypothetical protein
VASAVPRRPRRRRRTVRRGGEAGAGISELRATLRWGPTSGPCRWGRAGELVDLGEGQLPSSAAPRKARSCSVRAGGARRTRRGPRPGRWGASARSGRLLLGPDVRYESGPPYGAKPCPKKGPSSTASPIFLSEVKKDQRLLIVVSPDGPASANVPSSTGRIDHRPQRRRGHHAGREGVSRRTPRWWCARTARCSWWTSTPPTGRSTTRQDRRLGAARRGTIQIGSRRSEVQLPDSIEEAMTKNLSMSATRDGLTQHLQQDVLHRRQEGVRLLPAPTGCR